VNKSYVTQERLYSAEKEEDMRNHEGGHRMVRNHREIEATEKQHSSRPIPRFLGGEEKSEDTITG
jgi:hypothetical protein